MRIEKCNKRDRQISRRKHGHVIDNRSIFILEEIQRKKAEKAKRKQERRLHKEDIAEKEREEDGESSRKSN